MKYVFLLVLLVVAGVGGLLGAVAVLRWNDNMTQTVKFVPGERNFAMPAGVVPRGGELVYAREQRELATRQPNPVKATAESIALGKQNFQTFCVPCHGAEAKGGVTGLVATKFIPPPDLTNADLQKQRTDGYWHSYIMVGGAVMPAYGEAVSSQEAWHMVNYLRSVAAR
ncbi:MAG: c-type cytochrome [Candidatus Rokubacteria bacterium]|nr:c-type cytochrome [Candidatus Rokubacteria bacterium]MBI3825454.1 c-type cytochrome [Candidatus Rokubacteria bacterium]